MTTPVVHQEKNKETNNQKNPLKMVLGGWEKNDEDETRDQGMLSCSGRVCTVQTRKRHECSDEHMTLSSSLTRIPPSLR